VYTQMTNISDMIWFCDNIEGQWCMIIPYIANHIQYVNIFVDLVFTTCLWFVYYLRYLYKKQVKKKAESEILHIK